MRIEKFEAGDHTEELDICWVGRGVGKLAERDDLEKEVDWASLDFVAFSLVDVPPCLEQNSPPSEYKLVAPTDHLRKLIQKQRAGLAVPVVSPWISTDSDRVSEKFKKYSSDALQEEFRYAAFYGPYACILPTPDSIHCARYANAVLGVLRTESGQQCRAWVRIPMTMDPQHFDGGLEPKVPAARPSPPAAAAAASMYPGADVPVPPTNAAAAAAASFSKLSDEDNETERRRVLRQKRTRDDAYDGWRVYKSLKVMCGHLQNLAVALVMTKKLPAFLYIARWLSEKIGAVIIPLECFVENSHGCPQLPDRHAEVVQRFVRRGAKVVIQIDRTQEDDLHSFLRYRQCVEKVWDQIEKLDKVQIAGHSDRDCLQPPFQPLADNLGSGVYSVFEKDSVKYDGYKVAVKFAVEVKVWERRGEDGPLVLMVVGAGRGPLVTASILAIKEADMTDEDIKIIAVEKNPNAFITLNDKKKMEKDCPLWSKVEILNADMRDVAASFKGQVDIIVSELLGSFGDNELSPECLDGAQRCLKKGGFSIPNRSVSYAWPISSTKLWTDANKLGKEFLETPLVVHIHCAYFPAVEGAQPVFTFEHPNEAVDPAVTSNAHNKRHNEVQFTMSTDAVLHGIAGYFHADLFGHAAISIVKETHTKDMASWWPIFFPIKEPISVKKGDNITLCIWRCDDAHHVWYEWCLTGAGTCSSLHNVGGGCYRIGK